MRTSEEESKPLENFPALDALPVEEREKEEPSFIRKLDFSFDPDCKTCKVISASVCYGSGVLVFSSMKQIPKMSAKIMTGVFGVGLFVAGTLRLLVPGNDINAPLFGRQSEHQNTSQDNS